MPTDLRTLTARWIFPADGPPLPGGTIAIQSDRIVAVETAGTRTADEDLGNVAILPGLVNAHTHLDLSDARGKIPPTPDFTAWLRGVIDHRREQASIDKAIQHGITESTRNGVTLVGEIAASERSIPALAHAPVRASVFLELVGLSLERARKTWRGVLNERQLLQKSVRPSVDCGSKTLLIGLSPHAPYSVSDWLFKMVARTARDQGIPVAIHLAESKAEVELLETHLGDFVTFLSDLSAWDPTRLVNSIGDLINAYFGDFRVLLVHCNYLGTSQYVPPNASIVYCPRTHAAFGHPAHPFREFMKRGVRVVLGTDSLASNPDLDILAEARFVHARHPDLPGETLLRMITLDGAIALGWSDVAGSLTPGKSADLVVLPLPDREEPDPHRLVFDSALSAKRVMFRGEWTASVEA